ncbi:metallophosphoesterase family protein [Mucilaginibacter sp. X5P1]|uniref:metallophosphoesterase family protein n=1 Tax=Mucilaginibacter sp. X5P1 TaxID=2723088 RepID=UPI00160D8287|nr:metallophosphoesterase family protein [Mucilaginibacter sp. X5P1]MBB6141145.1 putative phosphoesterase [Mucilaginibacter sp. X5P1]
MKQYAIISDIHGNSTALQAVLQDIKTRNIDTIINLGDYFFGALEPAETAKILQDIPMICISGNTDREIVENNEKDGMRRVRAELSPETINWLKDLPKTTTVDDLIFVCHGTPESDDEYLLEKVTEQGVFVYNDEDLIEKTKHIKEKVILCGHSHVNRVIYLSNEKLIVNPGSVGLPAYLGNAEYRFAMESMTPHAKYAVIQVDGDNINIEQVNCTYDWNAAAQRARNNGNDKVAEFLLHGRMPKDLRVN